jgi:hypothetical protein
LKSFDERSLRLKIDNKSNEILEVFPISIEAIKIKNDYKINIYARNLKVDKSVIIKKLFLKLFGDFDKLDITPIESERRQISKLNEKLKIKNENNILIDKTALNMTEMFSFFIQTEKNLGNLLKIKMKYEFDKKESEDNLKWFLEKIEVINLKKKYTFNYYKEIKKIDENRKIDIKLYESVSINYITVFKSNRYLQNLNNYTELSKLEDSNKIGKKY